MNALANKLSEERRARLAAERLLELKQSELQAANRKLGRHAMQLTAEISQTRAEVETYRDENQRVKSDLSAAHQQIELVQRRLWHSIEVIQDGFAFFDGDGRLIGANQAYLNVFDGLEEVAPGVAYARILQLITEEGIVNIVGDHGRALLRPARLGVAALHEIPGDRLDRLGVDPCRHAPEQPRGLHELGGHGERRRLARQRRPGSHSDTGLGRNTGKGTPVD